MIFAIWHFSVQYEQLYDQPLLLIFVWPNAYDQLYNQQAKISGPIMMVV